jgi:hypothetical protein
MRLMDLATTQLYFQTPTDRWLFATGGLRMKPGDHGFKEVPKAQVLRDMRLFGMEKKAALLEAKAPEPQAQLESTPSRAKPKKGTKGEQAIGLWSKHPNLSNRQIAAEIGCNPGTVSRALRKLREAERERGRKEYAKRQEEKEKPSDD